MTRKIDVNNINLQINNISFWGPHEKNKGGMRIEWSSDIGHGELDIVKRAGNIHEDTSEELLLTAHTEHMDSGDDKAFTEKLMVLIVAQLRIAD